MYNFCFKLVSIVINYLFIFKTDKWCFINRVLLHSKFSEKVHADSVASEATNVENLGRIPDLASCNGGKYN